MTSPSPSRFPDQPAAVRVLLVHGTGRPEDLDEPSDAWAAPWIARLTEALVQDDPGLAHPLRAPIFEVFTYSDLIAAEFVGDPPEVDEFSQSLEMLGWSGSRQPTQRMFRQSRGMDARAEALRWTAGMIVRWARKPDFRSTLRAAVARKITAAGPDVIVAQSLGSLICYDAFVNYSSADLGHRSPRNPLSGITGGADLVRGRCFISFGSQLGNAYVRNLHGGRLVGLPSAAHWFHLYNPNDELFTANIRLHGEDCRRDHPLPGDNPREKKDWINFHPVLVPFDNPDPLDHAAVSSGPGTIGYLDRFETRRLVWPQALYPGQRPLSGIIRRSLRPHGDPQDHRALLIGIDHYGRSDIPSLEGCVNDTYLISALLQETGFPVENIRLLHNERADSAAIRDRLDWLLDDVDPGGFRLLYFSGHGHQLEGYGVGETVDRLDECLCPHDYDYTPATAILDDHILSLYSQLPYESQFAIILDCCHSGGMSRSGSARMRGLGSPLDVAHRGLVWNWDKKHQRGAWIRPAADSRELTRGDGRKRFDHAKDRLTLRNVQLPETAAPGKNLSFVNKDDYVGRNGTLRRFGRAISLRRQVAPDCPSPPSYIKEGTPGPFLPVIVSACAEDDVALEHQDGHVTYGAFTFALDRAWRSLIRGREDAGAKDIRWEQLVELATAELKDLCYVQKPKLILATDQQVVALGNPWNRQP